MSLETWADFVGLVSSIVFFYPAYRLSRRQRRLKDDRAVLATAGKTPTAENLAAAANALERHLGAWDFKAHYALLGGLALLVLSYLLKLLA